MSAPPQYEILGAVKVKDGLFIGDEVSSQDLEFVVSNKVTHVINCAGRQVPNHWEPIGVVYLTYYWVDEDSQMILDQRDVVANDIFQFIEEALEHSESVLVHSARGQSRSCCVLAAYMMRKYSWTLKKTMEFLSSRRPDLNLKPSFLQQLSAQERRLMASSRTKFSSDWSEPPRGALVDSEEMLLRNTYMNSQMGPLAGFTCAPDSAYHPRLHWMDGCLDEKSRLEVPSGATRTHCRRAGGQLIVKPILKWGALRPMEPRDVQERDVLRETAKGTALSSVNSRPTTASSENALLPDALRHKLRDHAPGPHGGDNFDRHAQPDAPPRLRETPSQDRLPRDLDDWKFSNLADRASTRFDSRLRDVDPKPGTRASFDMGSGTSYSDDRRRGSADEEHRRSCPSSGLIATSISLAGKIRREEAQARRDPSPQVRRDASGLRRDASPQVRHASSPTMRRDASPAQSLRKDYGMEYGARRDPSPRISRPQSAAAPPLRKLVPSLAPSLRDPAPLSGGMGFGPGMGSFRGSGAGPVKARPDLGRDAYVGDARRSRPATAPTTRDRRPASPLSRIAQADPKLQGDRGSGFMTSDRDSGFMTNGRSPLLLDRSKHKSLSSHMRRAPSPTPAFNRQPSPGRPRWR